MSEKEYIVSIENRDDLDQFYDQMESNKSTEFIPSKQFQVSDRREISRNTHYIMTDDEAAQLRNDPRILAVEEPPENRGIKIEPCFTWDNTIHFDKGGVTSSDKVQWGILRCFSGKSSSAEYVGTWAAPFGKIDTGNEEGENVDIVIVDGHIDPDHPEFAVNRDGTGGSRVVQYTWKAGYSYFGGSSTDNDHGMHVAGIAAGNRQGWAVKSNIYNINPYDGQYGSSTLFDAIRTFHNAKTNGNPTVVNNSWTYVRFNSLPINQVYYRGTLYEDVGYSDARDYGIHCPNTSHWKVSSIETAADLDIADAINDGIIIVGAGNNFNMKITRDSSDADYNNYLKDGFGFQSPRYYARGGSPIHTDNAICVGNAGFGFINGGSRNDAKHSSSCKGPRIDIFAPGDRIQSSTKSLGITDGRDSDYRQNILTGTSMASPQVAGVLACVVGVYRNFNQADCLDWLISRSTKDQIYDSGSSNQDDSYNLLGAPQRYLHFHKERKLAGHVFPDMDRRVRDTHSTSSRQVYPRVKRNYNNGNS
tara:strand:- start:21 stop:1616 length:1596 start_codon:yes stop_codon:yes gene_type:complete